MARTRQSGGARATRRRLGFALRLLCLFAFLLASLGTHEAAWAASLRGCDAPAGHGAHHAPADAEPCQHDGHGKATTACCLAGPCKLAVLWPAPPALPPSLPGTPAAARLPVPAEATPAVPWRPPA